MSRFLFFCLPIGMLLLLATISTSFGQDLISDLTLITKHAEGSVVIQNTLPQVKKSAFMKYNPVSLTLNGLLTFYQKIISPQISAGCLYDVSCSRFSRAAITEFGAIKGVFLTADRLNRCNRITAADIPRSRIKDGKVKDPLDYYKLSYHNQHTH